MKGEQLSSEHHISRYCGGSHISEDGEIAPTAFYLRPDEPFLSVNCLELTNRNHRQSQLSEVCQRLELEIGRTAKVAILNVGQVCQHVKEESDFEIRILHDPKDSDFSHSGIHDTVQDEIMIAALIAEKILDTYLPFKSQ
jgi:hypothetical protein